MPDKQDVLRSALSLEQYEEIIETDDPDVFFVDRKKGRGVYGFTDTMPGDTMDVYMVIPEQEADNRGMEDPVCSKDGYLIFKL